MHLSILYSLLLHSMGFLKFLCAMYKFCLLFTLVHVI